MAFISRIRTIIGNDANLISAISRLLFYVRIAKPWSKFKAKLLGTRLNHQEIKIPMELSENQKKLWEVIRINNPFETNRIKDYIQNEKLDATIISLNEIRLFQYLPKGNPLISIIIPTKNRSELVRVCVDSILKHSTYTHFEIILVDNRSDESELSILIQQYLKMEHLAFKHVKADIDFNFSALMNLGLAHAQGEHVLFLNNDTEIITPQWMEYLLGFSQQDDVGAVGCKLLYPNETIQHAGIVLQESVLSRHQHVGKGRYDSPISAIEVFPAVTAACLMVSKEKCLAVGGFDESFKVEFNDIDFCLKLLAKGYLNVYLPQVELFHYESASRRHPFSDAKNYTRHLLEKAHFRKKWNTLFELPEIMNEPTNSGH